MCVCVCECVCVCVSILKNSYMSPARVLTYIYIYTGLGHALYTSIRIQSECVIPNKATPPPLPRVYMYIHIHIVPISDVYTMYGVNDCTIQRMPVY